MKLRTGSFQVLDEEECRQICEAALRVLRRVSLHAQGTDEFFDYLRRFGCRVEGERVRFPDAVVTGLLERIEAHRASDARTPSEENRDPGGDGRFGPTGRRAFPSTIPGILPEPDPRDAGSPALTYAATGQALWCADPADDRLRPSTEADLAELSRIADAIPGLTRSHPTFIPQDVPRGTCDLHAFATVALNSSRLYPVSVYSVRTLPYFIEVQAIAQGGMEKARGRPAFYAHCWWNTPFMLTRENIEIGMKARELLGMPLATHLMPVAGTSTPATLAGSLTLTTAEVLAFNIVTLAVDDRLAGYCAGPLAMDARSGAHANAGPASDLLRLGACRMGLHIFGAPTGYLGSPTTSATVPGAQAMMEKSLQTAFAVLGGARGFGSLGTLATSDVGSAVQLLLDVEMVRHFDRLLEGIRVDPERLAEELICEIVPQGARFIDTDHTSRYFRRELWLPEFLDTRAVTAWMRDPITMVDAARRKALRLGREAPNRCPLSDDQCRAIREVVAEADRRLG